MNKQVNPKCVIFRPSKYKISGGGKRTRFKDVVLSIEILNNTRGSIDGKIGERGVWGGGGGGANSSIACSLIHDVPDKINRFGRVLLKLLFSWCKDGIGILSRHTENVLLLKYHAIFCSLAFKKTTLYVICSIF